MTLNATPGFIGVNGSRPELEVLLGYIACDDHDALTEFVRITTPSVVRWLQAGIAAGARQDDIVTAVYRQVWGRAAEFQPGDVGPLNWLAGIVRAVLLSRRS